MIFKSGVSYFSEESDSLTGILPTNGPKTSVPSVDDTHICDKGDGTGASKEPQRDSTTSETSEAAQVRPKYRFSDFFFLFMLLFLFH